MVDKRTELTDPNLLLGKWLSSPEPGEEIVISGLSGQFPNSRNIHELRDNLFSKTDMIDDDCRRWKVDHPEIPKRTGKVYDIDKIDAGYFGLHHQQAVVMDPTLRLMLESCIEAILDAGVNPSDLEGTKTGVFIAVCFSDIEYLATKEQRKFMMTGFARSVMAHRISFHLKLKGPSFNMDTACSSSFIALDHAYRAMRNGTCDNAIIATGNLLLHPGGTLQFFRLGVLSIDGSCKVFDQDANGYVRAETVAAVFLQKAKKAKRIYVQIIHSKVNSDGYKDSGLTFPSTESQTELMNQIYEECRVHPSELSYVEAHGTGTQIGDTQELDAIDLALAKKREKPLVVGAVKSNVGHSEPSSGICSLVKVVLAIETGKIAPNIHIKKIKEGMTSFEEKRSILVTELTDLDEEKEFIAINNFGFGGSNVHVVLRKPKKNRNQNGFLKNDLPRLVCVSGRTSEAVLTLLNNTIENKIETDFIALIQQTYENNVNGHIFRGFTILDYKEKSAKTSCNVIPAKRPPLYFLFGCFNEGYRTLGKDFLTIPAFKSTVKRINNLLKLQNIDIAEGKTQTENSLTAAVVQLSIADVLSKLELDCTAAYGIDDLGKIVASFYHRVVTLEEAVLAIPKINGKLETTLSNVLRNSVISQNDGLKKNFQHAFVLNFSDIDFGDNDKVTNSNSFLNSLGRLYEQGFNFKIHKLYEEFKFPVGRGTTMVSPSIKWNHERNWQTFKFNQSSVGTWKYVTYSLGVLEKEDKYLQGHVIDGRNLVPATKYLSLVWQTFIENHGLSLTETKIIFQDCKFMRATLLQKTGFIILSVAIQQGTGRFEVMEKDNLVASGTIILAADTQNFTDSPKTNVSDNSETVLQHDEIYREMYLRGYNYSDVFKGVMKYDPKSNWSLIKWEDNWTAYIDKMLQMNILQIDSRLLFVPTVIRKLIIDPQKHLNTVANAKENLISAYAFGESNRIQSGGIEIWGLQARSISKKKQVLEPVLEKQEFVYCKALSNIAQAIRVNTQIILENCLENNFKAVEIADNSNTEFILPLVANTLDDLPLVNPVLTLSTENTVENIPGIKIEIITLKADSNFLLIIGSRVLENLPTLNTMLSALNPNGFILSRENLDFNYCSAIQDDVLELFTEYTTETEKLVLLKKRKPKNTQTKYIEIDEHFDWITNLQNSMKEENTDVVVHAKNLQPNGILGLFNCLRREPGGSKVKCFFTLDKKFNFNIEEYSQKTQMAINVFKNFERGTYRHLLLNEVQDVSCTHCFVNNTIKSDLSSLRWLQGYLTPETPLSGNEILVYSHYAALNFKDIVLASGRIGAETVTLDRLGQENLLGLEYSGKDINGKKIAGMVCRNALSTMVIADSAVAWNVPDHWTLEDAATVPVVYCTVVYALFVIAKLQRGASILIHSAAGGIGLAAINVCRHYGCEIFLTLGTQEKRDYIRQQFPEITDDHIGNSRDTSFEEMINQVTEGRGVDIVLNSLSEDKLKASIRCLKIGGHFLEIGKYDLVSDSSLQLLIFEKELNYHGIMLDSIFQTSEKIKEDMCQMVEDGIQIGYVKPLPRVIFEPEQVEQAFRYLSRGQHIGKVLIKLRDETDENTSSKQFKAMPRFNCDWVKSYVIIGGLGGIGLELADWMVIRGARKLILSSRTGVQTAYQTQRIKIWKSYGVTVYVDTNDVTTEEGCLNLIKVAANLGPVDAVFNLAVVLQDALFEDQTEEKFKAALAPKAQTTNHLDVVTRMLCPELRYFVTFSSVSCGRGNLGQTNYGMANSIMERICENRKNDGLPALAIQWGAIGDVGLVAKMQKENKELVIGGTLQQKISSCLEVLDKFLIQDSPIVSSMLVAVKTNRSLGIATPTDAVASILGIKDLKTISHHATLAELGMDSMRGTEIIQVLENDFDIYLTTKEIKSLSFAKLAEIEAGKEGSGAKRKERGVNYLIQSLPVNKWANAPLIAKMSSSGEDKDHLSTIFILPGIDGILKPLESFAKELKAHVYGIQYDYKNPENSIEDFATNIFAHMELLLPEENNFNIVAYSFGVNIGLEIVHLVEAKGYTGQFLAIDGSPSYLKASLDFLPSDNEVIFETMLLFKLLSMVLSEKILFQNREKLMKFETFVERADYGLSLIPSETIKNLNVDTAGVVMILKRIKAVLKYEFVHEKIKRMVHLLKTSSPMVDDETDYGLSKICEEVKVKVLEGDHVSVLESQELPLNVNELFNLNDI